MFPRFVWHLTGARQRVPSSPTRGLFVPNTIRLHECELKWQTFDPVEVCSQHPFSRSNVPGVIRPWEPYLMGIESWEHRTQGTWDPVNIGLHKPRILRTKGYGNIQSWEHRNLVTFETLDPAKNLEEKGPWKHWEPKTLQTTLRTQEP